LAKRLIEMTAKRSGDTSPVTSTTKCLLSSVPAWRPLRYFRTRMRLRWSRSGWS